MSGRDNDQPFEGAIQQITPGPDAFVPQGALNFGRGEDQIIIKRKPHRNRILAMAIYFSLQTLVLGGVHMNYSLFGSFADVVLWSVTLLTFVAYCRVAFSNPGYVEGHVIMTEEPVEEDIPAFETQPAKEPKNKEAKRSVKSSVLTKGLSKHSRFVKSNQGISEHARHVRTSSVGSNHLTHSNQYSVHKGYAKLGDQTFKSGDFSKLRTEMEDLEFEPTQFTGKGHHRRKTSLIKKIGAIHQSSLSDYESQPDKDNERSKAFNLMAERIANSRATVETDHFTPSTPPGNDTNATFHKRTNSGQDEDDKGMFKAFKEGEETTENKQLPLASNAVTNDTDNLASNTQGVKRMLAENDIEEIKEVDENNESYDARKQFENLDPLDHVVPEVNLEKRVVSDGNKDYDLELGKHGKQQDTDFDEEFKDHDTQEDDNEDDVNMLFVEQKLCTVCNIEQPLRTKHCRSCRKCVATYDHHCPWVGNCIAEKNRKYFFVYICIQTLQVTYGLLYTFYILSAISWESFDFNRFMLVISLLGEVFFTLMLMSLIIFHFYLLLNNFTTWETISWNKISYMRIWPRKYGSPFNRGTSQNVKNYFCEKTKGSFMTWKMPKKLPSISQGEKIIEKRKYSYLFEKVFIKCQ